MALETVQSTTLSRGCWATPRLEKPHSLYCPGRPHCGSAAALHCLGAGKTYLHLQKTTGHIRNRGNPQKAGQGSLQIPVRSISVHASTSEIPPQAESTCSGLSRRALGLVILPLVLVGTRKARADELQPSSLPPPEPSEEVTQKSEPKDEMLESEDIKVSGGTAEKRRGKLELGPDFRRYRAEDFSIYVPRAYVNVTETDDNPRSTLTMEQKAANRPYAARFTSPDQSEAITVVIRDATTLRLSFLQTKDISDLGSLDKAAGLLLPPGAKVLKSRVVTQEVDRGQELEKVVKSLPLEIDTKLVRNYYQYEFYARGQQVALAAAAQNGKVYVVGATVPTKKWKELAKQMRAVTNSFELR